MPNSSSPSNNSSNLSNNPSKTFNAPDQNSWVTMTETTISEEGDVECTSTSREIDPTSSQASNVPTDHVTSSSTTPKSEASHEASRHSSPETGIPRSSPGVVEKPFRFSSRNECGYDIDLDVESNPDDVVDDVDDDDEYHYTYTYTNKPPLAHPPYSPPPSQSSHTPRTPHILHSLELIDLFPDLRIRDDHLTNYFQNIGFFKDDDINIPREPKSQPKSKLHDNSNSGPDPHHPPLSKQSSSSSSFSSSSSSSSSPDESTHHKPPQNTTTANGENKTTDIYANIQTHRDQSSQQTNSSIFQIPDIEERDYEQDAARAHLDAYPENVYSVVKTRFYSQNDGKIWPGSGEGKLQKSIVYQTL
ncbi:hypothetical protein BofuT4_P152500.1 [Botrytis cinerea T4]|uniref:Uncharacterized protein n=1 Tax=Botryotinia fuckeliana (strain T4) TaxID=999810 RepID=G2YVP0_BOTF4|nr:hypothetical protein BofuT4_P152500.1 [Botrytis cinerea T4]